MPGLDVNFYAGVLHSSTEETILPTPWSHLADHMKRRNRVVHRVRGDGLCFINAVATCLEQDHNITIQISEIINIILQHLTENHQDCVHFHVVPEHSSEDGVTNSDMHLNEAMDFFQDRNYNKDIVDLLVTTTAYALGLDLCIYQSNQGKFQLLKYSGAPISKSIYLKFTHNDLKLVENHYDAVIDNQLLIEKQEEILQSKSTVASRSMDQNK